MKFYDVSPEIKKNMLVYPGNPEPKIERYASIPTNKNNESLICLGSHTGSHVDSLFHIRNDGAKTGSLPLTSFYGDCQVLDLTSFEQEILREDLEPFKIPEEG